MACGCGGKGKRKKGGVRVAKSNPKIKAQILTRGTKSLTCPLCTWPIRRLHSYNKESQKMDVKVYCTNAGCKKYG